MIRAFTFWTLGVAVVLSGQAATKESLQAAQSAIAAGEYSRALDHAREGLEAARHARDERSEGVAHNLLGQAHLYKSDYAAAAVDFQHALEIAESLHDTNAASVRRGNIGNVYFFQGRYLDALQQYQSALQTASATGGASNGRQLALANLAILYEQLGQNEKALGYYRQAAESAAALQPAEYAQLLSNSGTLYRRMGDPVKALGTYEEARRIFARAKHSDGEIHVMHNVGLVLSLDEHEDERALATFTEALRLAERTANARQALLGHLYRGESLRRLNRNADALSEYRAALETAGKLGASEEKWQAQYGMGQSLARSGNAAAALASYRAAIETIEGIRGSLGSSSLKAEFLGNKRSVYDAYIGALLDGGAPDINLVFEAIEKARARNLLDALRRKLPAAGLEHVRQRLDRGSLLVEYWVGQGRLAALWITRDGTGILQRPFTSKDDAAVRATVDAFDNQDEAEWRPLAAALGRVLLDGLPLSARYHDLLLVPDGVLSSVPFDVLPGNGGRMLIEDFAISFLPSAGLLLSSESPRRTPPWRRQLLAFGDPLPPEGDEIGADGTWGRLPESAREAGYIVREVSGRAETHLGSDDLKRHLLEGGVAPLMHFGTHAALDLRDPYRSRILFTGDAQSAGSKYLFWQEAQQLHLSGADLVTLAACDTEGGKLTPGEGIQSFSRAFLAAGARSTVTSLWRVGDRASAEFMRLFYGEIARRAPKAEALRRAKLAMLRSGGAAAHPRHWAAFVLTGDGTKAAPLWSWSDGLVPGAALTAALAVAALLRRGARRRKRLATSA